MSISVRRVRDGYEAQLSPPHGKEPWTTEGPITKKQLIAKLGELGCHQTDIGDAFYSADPLWLARDEED
jgi:hypothetical protein